MSERDKILAKIKKCLALGKSSNEHEAAAALRQAQALMEKHGVSDLDMAASEASEKRARAGAVQKPASWEFALAVRVSKVFGCRVVFGRNLMADTGEWRFIGTGAAPEIAEYAFRVLFRQVKAARSDYVKAKLKRCGPATKTRRADLFCEGWVYSVGSTLTAFSGGDSNSSAIAAYMAQRYPRLCTLQAKNRNEGKRLGDRDYHDLAAGGVSGRNAVLNRGVAGQTDPLALKG